VSFVLFSASLVVVSRSIGFTGGGDEWFLMRAIRYFMEARPIVDVQNFAAWEMVVGLLGAAGGVELVDVYRAVLSRSRPAGRRFRARAGARGASGSGAAIAALATWALLCLSQMNTRGDGAGMSLLIRLGRIATSRCWC
jgi:hypothetical protein